MVCSHQEPDTGPVRSGSRTGSSLGPRLRQSTVQPEEKYLVPVQDMSKSRTMPKSRFIVQHQVQFPVLALDHAKVQDHVIVVAQTQL